MLFTALHRSFWSILALIFVLHLISHPAVAQPQQQFSSSPALIKADKLTHDAATGIVTAEGNVEITQGERILIADYLTYNQNTNIVNAKGNISLLEPSGNVYFAEEANLKDDLKKGVVDHFSARFTNNALLASGKAERINEKVTQLEKAVYSACKVCEGSDPLWQIKADKVKIDEGEERVRYKHAFFEVFGMPILYTPYFSHPSPGAKRKNGFLIPSYSSISTLGVTVKVPYYYNIAPNMDATFTPIITTDEGPVLSGDFRHLTEKGSYELAGSITNPKERDEFGFRSGGRDIRGHIEGAGNFTINDTWGWGFSGKRSSDDTYLQRYKFGNEDLLTSKAYIQQIDRRNYIGAETITFQGLNAEDDPGKTPLILPMINTHHETEPGWMGSRFTLDGNALSLTRSEGVDSHRVSAKAGWLVPYTTQSGHVFELQTSIRGDAYSVNNVIDPLDPTNKEKGTIGRVIPETQLSWNYPLVNSSQDYRILVEPVANFIVSPIGGNPSKIPNEDSQELELSDVNLFSNNRFTGLDRVEGGPRANYGVRGSIHDNEGHSVNYLLGQSYRAKDDENFAPESGLADNFSDYVGRISLHYSKYLDAAYRFRLDKDDYELRRSEISNWFNFHPFAANLSYVKLNENIPGRPELDREEVFAGAALDVTDEWTFTAGGRRDLSEDGGPINASAGLIYENECIILSTLFNREFTRDRDIEPTTSFTFEVKFKSLNYSE